MAGPARRRPFPYDMVIAGVGVMLGHKDEQGAMPLVGTKIMPFDQAAPDDYQYDTQPPLYERVQPFSDMTLGFGMRRQSGYQDRKYRYTINADLSIGGLWMKGPKLVTYSPTYAASPGAGIDGMVEMAGALYAYAGRYFLQYNAVSDSWSTIKDFGVGAVVLDACAFSPPGSAANYIMVALGTQQNAWAFNGTTWTQFATHQSYAYQKVGHEFYRAGGVAGTAGPNQVSKVDPSTDPTNEANWSNALSFLVGDTRSKVVKLGLSATGTLIVFKTDGIYTINEAGEDVQLFTYTVAFPGQGPDTDNGKWWGIFGNDTYVTYAKAMMKLVPTLMLGRPHLTAQEIGPERNVDNDSPVNGRTTAFASHGAQMAFSGLYNDDTGKAYLLKFSSWIATEVANGQTDVAKRVDAWHGSITEELPAKITTLWRSTLGAPDSAHYRLWIGLADGTLRAFTLSCKPNPNGCAQYLFDNTADGQVFLPYWHGTFQADAKALRSISVLGQNLSPDYFVAVQFKTDPQLGTYTDFGTTFIGNRQKSDFPSNTGTYLADIQVILRHGPAGVSAASPLVNAFAIHHAVRPALILEYAFSVLAADGMAKRNGTPFKRIGAVKLRNSIKMAAQALGSVNAWFPDESNQDISITSYAEGFAWDERLRRWQASLDIKAVQYRINTVYGTWRRAQVYTWRSAQAYTWRQVQGI